MNQKLELLMILLPIVFMLHEYEEIIMFKHWLNNNRNELKRRFPKFELFLTRRKCFDYSTATFAIGTAHEFVLISSISLYSIWMDDYLWWFAAFSGYFIHLIVHLLQWVKYQKYVPVIITTILTLPYCSYTLVEFTRSSILSPLQMLLWAIIGIILTILSLLSAFLLMGRFQRWLERNGKMPT